MAAFDPNPEFEKVADKSEAACDKLDLAADAARDRAAADFAIADAKTAEAVDRLKKKVETTRSTVSEHWDEARAQRHAHDAGGKYDVAEAEGDADPKYPTTAPDPIDFADPSVDEAQEGVLDALDTRGAPEPPTS